MKQIRLVKNGIFPITKDKNGNAYQHAPDTGFGIAGTVQGEGILLGVPSIFIRLSGCNLRCAWLMEDGTVSICDTPYSSYHANEQEAWDIEDIVSVVAHNKGNITHAVLTGGEPVLQGDALAKLAELLKLRLHMHITLETNGTLFHPELSQWVDLFSISPKLSDSVPYAEKLATKNIQLPASRAQIQQNLRVAIPVLQQYVDLCQHTDKDYQLKFVVTRPENAQEIKADFLQAISGVAASKVVLMPVGSTTEELLKSARTAARIAIENGWRFTPRIQVDLFGNAPGT